MASRHPPSPVWITALVVLFSCACQARDSRDPMSSYDAKTIEKLRANYRFGTWPGKNLPVKSDLSADQITEAVRSWLKASKRPAEKLTVLPEGGGLHLYLTGHGVLTSRRYRARDGARGVSGNLVIYWAEQSSGAHEILMKIMSTPCVWRNFDKVQPPGDEVGNVCYRHQPGVQFGFIRNNMFVRTEMDPDRPTVEEDLLTLARALDKAIIANPLLPKPSDEELRWCQTVQLAPTRLRVGEKVRVTAGKVPTGTTWAVVQRGGPFRFRARSVVGASGGYVGVARQSGAHHLAAVLLRDGTGEVRAKRELRVNVIDAPEK